MLEIECIFCDTREKERTVIKLGPMSDWYTNEKKIRRRPKETGVYNCCYILIYTYVHAIVFCAILWVGRNIRLLFRSVCHWFCALQTHSTKWCLQREKLSLPLRCYRQNIFTQYTLTRCDIFICSYSEIKSRCWII